MKYKKFLIRSVLLLAIFISILIIGHRAENFGNEWNDLLAEWPYPTAYEMDPEKFKRYVNEQFKEDEKSRIQAFLPIAEEISHFLEETEFKYLFAEEGNDPDKQMEWYRKHRDTIADFQRRTLDTKENLHGFIIVTPLEGFLWSNYGPDTRYLRRAGHLFQEVSVLAWKAGDHDQTFDYWHTLRYLGYDIGRPKNLIQYLTLINLRSRFFDAVKVVGGEALSHPRWGVLEKELLNLVFSRAEMADVIPADMMTWVEVVQTLSRGDRDRVRELDVGGIGKSNIFEWWIFVLFRNSEFIERDMVEAIRYHLLFQEILLKDLFDQADASDKWGRLLDERKLRFYHGISYFLIPALDRVWATQTTVITQNRMLLIVSAIQSFYAENGVFPETLEDLGFPAEWNLEFNPFNGEPFAFETEENRFRLQGPNPIPSRDENPLFFEFSLPEKPPE